MPKAKTIMVAPLTLLRERPAQDHWEYAMYRWARLWRSFDSYKHCATQMLHVIVDDVFNIVIAVRLLCIFCGASPLFRLVLRTVGFSATVERHTELFQVSTGAVVDEPLNYWSDWMFGAVFGEVVGRVVQVRDVVTSEITVAHFGELLWRCVVPAMFFYGYRMLNAKLALQAKAFNSQWKGPAGDWTDGEYANCLSKYGSFWNPVDRDMWNTKTAFVPKHTDEQTAPKRIVSKVLSSRNLGA